MRSLPRFSCAHYCFGLVLTVSIALTSLSFRLDAQSATATPKKQLNQMTATLPARTVSNPQLFSGTTGYVEGNDHLFRTATSGQSWQDITPKADAAALLNDTFIDINNGYAILLHFAKGGGPGVPTGFDIYSTTNKGGKWNKRASLPASEFDIESFGGQAYVSFSDFEHGWIAISRASSANFSLGVIFSTSDGGSTWTALPKPPMVDNMMFTSPIVGYLFGGPSHDEIYRTNDGGATWRKIALYDPDEVDPSDSMTIGAPQFSDGLHGSVAVTLLKGSSQQSSGVLYTTSDGGESWSQANGQSKLNTNFKPAQALSKADPHDSLSVHTRPGSGIVTSHSSGGTKVAALPHSISSNAAVLHASFADNNHGWVLVHEEVCDEAKSGCAQVDRLLATSDAGASYTDITPPSNLTSSDASASPDISIPQIGKLGWDRQKPASYSQLRAWGGSGKVFAEGVYLGGINYKADNSLLTPAYSTELSCDGLSSIPLWVGPQADSSRIDSGAYAFIQGMQEAQTAMSEAAIELGLGTGIIYYDLEGYDSTSVNISGFIGGWVSALHANNWHAGVYFSPRNWQDILGAEPNVPDSIWPARYHYGLLTPTDVYHLSPMPDNVWTNDQRLLQFNKDQPKTYGFVSDIVDQDLLDGETSGLPYDSAVCQTQCDVCDPNCPAYEPYDPNCNPPPSGCTNPDDPNCSPGGGGCTDPCDPSCSNFAPGICGDCPGPQGVCDESCPQYDECACYACNG